MFLTGETNKIMVKNIPISICFTSEYGSKERLVSSHRGSHCVAELKLSIGLGHNVETYVYTVYTYGLAITLNMYIYIYM